MANPGVDLDGHGTSNGFTSGITASNTNYLIKHGKFHVEFTSLPSLLLSLSAAIKEFHYNARVVNKNPFTDAKSDSV